MTAPATGYEMRRAPLYQKVAARLSRLPQPTAQASGPHMPTQWTDEKNEKLTMLINDANVHNVVTVRASISW